MANLNVIELDNGSFEIVKGDPDNTSKIESALKLVDRALNGKLLLDFANLHKYGGCYVKGTSAYATEYRRMVNNGNRLRKACLLLIDSGEMISFTLRTNGEFRVNWFTEYVKPSITECKTIIDNSNAQQMIEPMEYSNIHNTDTVKSLLAYGVDVYDVTRDKRETNYIEPIWMDRIPTRLDDRVQIEYTEFKFHEFQVEQQHAIQMDMVDDWKHEAIMLKARTYKAPTATEIIASEF